MNQTDKKSSSSVSLGGHTVMLDLLEGVDRNQALMDVLHKESLKDKPLLSRTSQVHKCCTLFPIQLKQSTQSGIDSYTVDTGKTFAQTQNQYTANYDCPSTAPKRENPQVITPDQKERMEQNRKEALLKRQRQGQLDPQSFAKRRLLSDKNITNKGELQTDKVKENKAKSFTQTPGVNYEVNCCGTFCVTKRCSCHHAIYYQDTCPTCGFVIHWGDCIIKTSCGWHHTECPYAFPDRL